MKKEVGVQGLGKELLVQEKGPSGAFEKSRVGEAPESGLTRDTRQVPRVRVRTGVGASATKARR